jgi:ketosteroid isomerase-like protein
MDMLDTDMATPPMGLSLHSTHKELLRYLKEPGCRNSAGQTISKDFIHKMFATIDSRDWDGLQRVFDENIIYERPGYDPLKGYARVNKFYREERVIASGIHFLEDVIIGPESGACWGRFVGKHKNGSEIDERFADAYTFENGKIKTRKSYFFRPAV